METNQNPMNFKFDVRVEKGNLVASATIGLVDFLDHLAGKTSTNLDDAVISAVKPLLESLAYGKTVQGNFEKEQKE